jgi:cell division septal protein FtsQ
MKRQLNWSLMIWLAFVVYASLLLGLLFKHVVAQLPLEVIDLQGNMVHVKREECLEMIQPYLAKGFMGVELPKLQSQLLAHYPILAKVRVTRKWPNILQVQLTEREPLARLVTRDAQFLVDAQAAVFQADLAAAKQSLKVTFRGEVNNVPEMLQIYRLISNKLLTLSPHLTITELRYLHPGNGINVVLSNGVEIVLGQKQHLAERLKRFELFYKKLLLQSAQHNKKPVYIDTRYSNGVAVKW